MLTRVRQFRETSARLQNELRQQSELLQGIIKLIKLPSILKLTNKANISSYNSSIMD